MQYRQGDVLLIEQSIPGGAQRQKLTERIVLALGEATGHAHAISSQFAMAYQQAEDMYILTTEGATLVHEEHAPIKVTPGTYKVVRQRQYVRPKVENQRNWDEMYMD